MLVSALQQDASAVSMAQPLRGEPPSLTTRLHPTLWVATEPPSSSSIPLPRVHNLFSASVLCVSFPALQIGSSVPFF